MLPSLVLVAKNGPQMPIDQLQPHKILMLLREVFGLEKERYRLLAKAALSQCIALLYQPIDRAESEFRA
ncbi:MAG: hypothetical protein H6603_06505 [Flavobacteriales bacterium]|nr:hypothetical protein [Flavobacteriales bacterium]